MEQIDRASRESIRPGTRFLVHTPPESTIMPGVFDGTLRVLVPEETGDLLVIENLASGQQVGIKMEANGTIKIMGWDEDGECIELTPVVYPRPAFKQLSVEFRLDQYGNTIT